MLHITNGDHAANLIKAGLDAEHVIAWRDVLYEGPIPAHASHHQLRKIRAEYLSERGYDEFDNILEMLKQRDHALTELRHHEETILWFEHDVYDQLQLVQILDRIFTLPTSPAKLTLICINQFPGIQPFLGLGQLTAEQMAELFPSRQTVNQQQLELANTIWHAITAETPQGIAKLIQQDLSALPFVKNALIRYLQEFPSYVNGLTWTEQYILDSVYNNTDHALDIFKGLAIAEQEHFMGMSDSSFYKVLMGLVQAKKPLLRVAQYKSSHEDSHHLENITLELTKTGKKLLENKTDWLQINGLDCWRGGTHLTHTSAWRWDNDMMALCEAPSS